MIRLKQLLNEGPYSRIDFLIGDLKSIWNVLKRIDNSDSEYMEKYLLKVFGKYGQATPGDSINFHMEFLDWLEGVLKSNIKRIDPHSRREFLNTVDNAKLWWKDYYNEKQGI